MSPQISCSVYRCPKTAIAQCTGYRGTCERYYCQTHTEGTLCDVCVGLKQESLKTEYKDMLAGLVRQSYSAALTGSIIVLMLISAGLLVTAILTWFWHRSGESDLPVFVSSLAGGVGGLILAMIWYLSKTREFVRSESVSLDLNHPGFYDYYQQWQEKFDQITSNTP